MKLYFFFKFEPFDCLGLDYIGMSSSFHSIEIDIYLRSEMKYVLGFICVVLKLIICV